MKYTCVWLTAYKDKYVTIPPMIKDHHVCLTVGSKLKLLTKILIKQKLQKRKD